MFVNITVYKSVQRSGSAQTHWESLQTLTGFYGMGWGRVVRGGDKSTEGRVNAYASRHLNLWIHPELVIGHFFKTQPNPKFLDPTQTNPQVFTRPNPTHHRNLIWHIRLYRKLYTTTVTRHRQVHSRGPTVYSAC